MAAAAGFPPHRPGAELAALRAKPGLRLPPGTSAPTGHGRPRRARLLARLQEATGHAAAEAQTAAEERARRRHSPALRLAGPLRAPPPQPLLQPGQRAAGGRHPPAAGAGPAAAGGREPLGSVLLAGRSGLRGGRRVSLPPPPPIPHDEVGPERRGEEGGRAPRAERGRRQPSAWGDPEPAAAHRAGSRPGPAQLCRRSDPAAALGRGGAVRSPGGAGGGVGGSTGGLRPAVETSLQRASLLKLSTWLLSVLHLTLLSRSALGGCWRRQARQESRALWKKQRPRPDRCTKRRKKRLLAVLGSQKKLKVFSSVFGGPSLYKVMR